MISNAMERERKKEHLMQFAEEAEDLWKFIESNPTWKRYA